jgi:hypothetical protein
VAPTPSPSRCRRGRRKYIPFSGLGCLPKAKVVQANDLSVKSSSHWSKQAGGRESQMQKATDAVAFVFLSLLLQVALFPE